MKNDMRNGKNITFGNYNTCLDQARALGFKRTKEIENIPWNNVRYVIKAMKKRDKILLLLLFY